VSSPKKLICLEAADCRERVRVKENARDQKKKKKKRGRKSKRWEGYERGRKGGIEAMRRLTGLRSTCTGGNKGTTPSLLSERAVRQTGGEGSNQFSK